MVFLVKRPDRVDEGFSKADQRMDKLEKTSIKQGRTLVLAECSFWSILTGAMGRIGRIRLLTISLHFFCYLLAPERHRNPQATKAQRVEYKRLG